MEWTVQNDPATYYSSEVKVRYCANCEGVVMNVAEVWWISGVVEIRW